MRKILVFLIVYFFYSSSYAYQLSENVFVPNSILQTYNSLSKEHKIQDNVTAATWVADHPDEP